MICENLTLVLADIQLGQGRVLCYAAKQTLHVVHAGPLCQDRQRFLRRQRGESFGSTSIVRVATRVATRRMYVAVAS
jgi:hypothetical protein